MYEPRSALHALDVRRREVLGADEPHHGACARSTCETTSVAGASSRPVSSTPAHAPVVDQDAPHAGPGAHLGAELRARGARTSTGSRWRRRAGTLSALSRAIRRKHQSASPARHLPVRQDEVEPEQEPEDADRRRVDRCTRSTNSSIVRPFQASTSSSLIVRMCAKRRAARTASRDGSSSARASSTQKRGMRCRSAGTGMRVTPAPDSPRREADLGDVARAHEVDRAAAPDAPQHVAERTLVARGRTCACRCRS